MPEGDTLIIYIARVSNPGNQDNPDIAGLLRYLIREGHWSLFELANLCVEVECAAPIAE
jgi:thymidylate synthase (FAD)